MKKIPKRLFLIICTSIILMTIIPVKSAQTIDFRYYHHYDVKKGESMHYKYSYINVSYVSRTTSVNYIKTRVQLENGTSVPVNITTRQELTVSVTDIPNVSSYNPNFYNVSLDNKRIINSNALFPGPFINIAFDNNSIFHDYVDWINQTNHRSLIYDDNNLYFNYTFGGPVNNNPISEMKLAYNWHTGWLEYYDYKSLNVQGNEISAIHLERVQDGLLNQLTNFASTGFYLVIFVAIIGIPVYVLLNYKKFKTNYSESAKDISFRNYLQNNVKKTNKKNSVNRKSKKSVDHALEMIEEIISETNDQ